LVCGKYIDDILSLCILVIKLCDVCVVFIAALQLALANKIQAVYQINSVRKCLF